MPNDANEVEEFSFTWQALKLLGKSLYSNPWAAISELVANGFDADANNVWVLLDLSEGKDNATLQVRDDGVGMDREGVRNYVRVGRNKREQSPDSPVAKPMGRKGIGKLAALYLSDEFYMETTSEGATSTWSLVIDPERADDSKPQMRQRSDPLDLIGEFSNGGVSGTTLQILHIDLRGSGAASLDALGMKLANQFLLSAMSDRRIWFAIRSDASETIEYREVEKQVAFGNYMMAYSNFALSGAAPAELTRIEGRSVQLKVGETIKDLPVAVGTFAQLDPGAAADASGEIAVDDDSDESLVLPYELSGWLAVHATIDNELAKTNDDRFVKNQFYNPSQIRLYVRNKLAAENVLGMLGITQAYANYIEGEVSFDILDEDVLADIATTNRQGFDENDLRMQRLKELLRPLVRALIRKREAVMNELKTAERKRLEDIQSRAKAQFVSELRNELEQADVSGDEIENLILPIENKLVGSAVAAKVDHRIFLSHAGKDKALADFVYYLLREKGVTEDEIFYTSKDRERDDAQNLAQLKDRMRECITDVKTRIFYLASPNFGESTYCLFEGGAGWATRGVSDFDLVTTRFADAPVFLHNNQPMVGLLDSDSMLSLDRNLYFEVGAALNRLIEHINSGREILGAEERAVSIDLVEIPPPHQIPSGSSVREYMDAEFVALWDAYVAPAADHFVVATI